MDAFTRKADLNQCSENLYNDMNLLIINTKTFNEFTDNILLSTKLGHFEIDHIRPFLWKIFLDKDTWLSKTSIKEIVKQHETIYNNYQNKIKSLSLTKKFEKDPLGNSLDEDWKRFYQIQDVKKILNLDLVRTYPDKPLFKQEKIKQIITDVIVLWSIENSDLSYRQGMNEIIAVILISIFPYYFIDINNMPSSCPKQTLNKEILNELEKDINNNIDSINLTKRKNYYVELYKYLYNINTLESDVYYIFDNLMKNGMKDLYDITGKNISNSQNNKSNFKYYELFSVKIETENMNDTSKLKLKCDKIINKILKVNDIDLFNHFKQIEFNCLTFLQKWIKCLFNREFNIDNTIILWDVIFLMGNNLEFLEFVAIAMIESMKQRCKLNIIFIFNIVINSNQDEAFQYVFEFSKNNTKNGLQIIKEAFENKTKYESIINKKDVHQNIISDSPSTLTKINFTVNNISSSVSSNTKLPDEKMQIQQENTNKNVYIPSSTPSESSSYNNYYQNAGTYINKGVSSVKNYLGGYISSIGSFLKDVVNEESNMNSNNETKCNISYNINDICFHTSNLENMLNKYKDKIEPGDATLIEESIKFFKIGGSAIDK